jgi:hypothetical protein
MEYVGRVEVLDSEMKGIGYSLLRIAKGSSCYRTREVSECNLEQQMPVHSAMLNSRLYLNIKMQLEAAY